MSRTNFDEVAATFVGNLTGNSTGTHTGDVVGNITAFTAVARTATAAPGGTTGVIAAASALQLVTVTSDDANKVITLPAPVPGTMILLVNGATGYELRSSAPGTVSINGGASANGESAIAAATAVLVACTSATTWVGVAVLLSTLAAAAD